MGVANMAKIVLVVATLFLSASAVLAESSAWTDFTSYSAPVTAPEGTVPALNMASTRRAASNVYSFSGSATVQENAGKEARTFTVNSFIAGGKTKPAEIKANIFALCAASAKGTSFASTVATASKAISAVGVTNKLDFLPPQCMYCLTQGYGTTEATPGFYLPCGCQQTCVDVSGHLKANFARTGLASQSLTNINTKGIKLFPTAAGKNFQPLTTCAAYVDNQIVQNCPAVATFHAVLWPSVLASIAMLYTAYSMMNMSLDMDSLLYTVGSSKKEK